VLFFFGVCYDRNDIIFGKKEFAIMIESVQAVKKNMIQTFKLLSEASKDFEFISSDKVERTESAVPYFLFNCVYSYKEAAKGNVSRDVQEIVSLYRNQGQKCHWLTYSDQEDEGLHQALADHHLVPSGVVSGMSLALDSWNAPEAHLAGLEIRELHAAEDKELFRQTRISLSSQDDVTAEPVADCLVAASGSGVRHYLGFMDGQPVATIMTVSEGEVAGIYAVATLEAYRSRGIGGAILTQALRDAQADGYKWAVLQSSPMGQKLYLKQGFKEVVQMNLHIG
jgi:GNAT superfamily N-acetyltransferase